MKIRKDPVFGTFTIVGLDPDQFAYIVGMVGIRSTNADAKGDTGGSPLLPTADQVYRKLSEGAKTHGLQTAVSAAERAQWQWMRRQALRERRERVA